MMKSTLSRSRSVLFVLLLVAAESKTPCQADSTPHQRPNIVHIVADDLGWNDVGFHGSDIQTPRIDALAAESMVLDRFYVTPICSPTRAGLMTGRYPFRFGIWGGVCNPRARHGLPASELTIAELLARAGYQSRGMFGKWHLGLASTEFHPLQHGFTEFYGHYNGAIDYFTRERHGQLDWHQNYESVYEEGYSTELVAGKVVEFIESQTPDAPFYAYVAFNAPHSPVQALEHDLAAYGFDPRQKLVANTVQKLANREGAPEYGSTGRGNTVRQTFSAMTTSMDRGIGRILDALDRKGVAEDTLLIFHSDNGGIPAHGGSNHPLRGDKFTTWEGGVRVVALVRWPGRLKGGSVCQELTSYIDVMPTFASAAGVEVPDVDGINLLPILTRKTDTTDRMLLLGKNAIVSKRWKWKDQKLFDLQLDPSETEPVEIPDPLVVERMSSELSKFSGMVGKKCFSSLPLPAGWPPHEWKLPVVELKGIK